MNKKQVFLMGMVITLASSLQAMEEDSLMPEGGNPNHKSSLVAAGIVTKKTVPASPQRSGSFTPGSPNTKLTKREREDRLKRDRKIKKGRSLSFIGEE